MPDDPTARTGPDRPDAPPAPDASDAPIARRAQARFAGLRERAADALASGETVRRLAEGPEPVPPGWCISVIARLGTNDPAALAPVTRVQDRIAAAATATAAARAAVHGDAATAAATTGPDAHGDAATASATAAGPDATGDAAPFRYDPDSLHLSLLGCTQREPDRTFAAERCGRIVEVVRRTVAGADPVAAHLGRLNLLGTQWFVEVTPHDEAWSTLRRVLVAPLRSIGEDPIAYDDTEPVHLNVARLDRLAGEGAAARAAALLADPPDVDRTVTLHRLEVVVTDFVVDPAQLRVLATIDLPE